VEENKEAKIQELRNRISYWIEKSKTINSQVEKGILSDKILTAKKEIGVLESKTLDRIKRVDIIDAAPVADRLESRISRSGNGYSYKAPKDGDKSGRVEFDISRL